MEPIIRVKAFPDAKKEHIEEIAPYQLRIFVREGATRNQANKKILELVALFYQIPKNNLVMTHGHHNQNKIIQTRNSHV